MSQIDFSKDFSEEPTVAIRYIRPAPTKGVKAWVNDAVILSELVWSWATRKFQKDNSDGIPIVVVEQKTVELKIGK